METKMITSVINVGVLDIRRTPREPVGEFKMINVGTVLYSQETARLLKGGKRINVGNYVEASPEATVLVQPVVFSGDYFEKQETPLDILVFGPVTFEHDVTGEALETGLARLSVFGGPLICPQHLLGSLQAKIQQLDGQTVAYSTASVRVTMGRLVLDENYLQALEDGAELVAVGPLRLPRVLPNDLLERKIKRLHALEGILCHEENYNVLKNLLEDGVEEIKTIPAGFELVERPLVLNNALLESLEARKLYCTRWVRIGEDVTPSTLDGSLEALISNDRVFCPENLKGVISRKCDWSETHLLFYEGELWFVDDERSLPDYAFDALDGKATLVVLGELRVDEGIPPQTLAECLYKVHNLGSIWCTPGQMEAIRGNLGLSEGELLDSTRPERRERPVVSEEDLRVHEKSYLNTPYVAL